MKVIKFLEKKKKESTDAWSYDEIKAGTKLDDHDMLQQLLYGMLMKIIDGIYIIEEGEDSDLMTAYFKCV